jgi:hypothetical protein
VRAQEATAGVRNPSHTTAVGRRQLAGALIRGQRHHPCGPKPVWMFLDPEHLTGPPVRSFLADIDCGSGEQVRPELAYIWVASHRQATGRTAFRRALDAHGRQPYGSSPRRLGMSDRERGGTRRGRRRGDSGDGGHRRVPDRRPLDLPPRPVSSFRATGRWRTPHAPEHRSRINHQESQANQEAATAVAGESRRCALRARSSAAEAP